MHRTKPAPVDETDEEDQAQRDPGPPGVEHLAAERADAPSRHLPRDLRAGPRLRHLAVAVVDLAERDLAGAPRPDVNRPTPGGPVERGVGRGIGRIAVEPVGHLRLCEESSHDDPLGQARAVRRGERLTDGIPGSTGGKGGDGGRGVGGTGGGGEQKCERERAHPPDHRRRNDQSLLPTKLSGVTNTIAIACAGSAPSPASTRRYNTTRFPASAVVETTRNRRPW